jgi:hypothetical protein
MIVDEHLGIQGNGNQDTQSWFHSMEVNIMIDSHEICKDWIEQLRRNQSTNLNICPSATADIGWQIPTFTDWHLKKTASGETKKGEKSRARLARIQESFRGQRVLLVLFSV